MNKNNNKIINQRSNIKFSDGTNMGSFFNNNREKIYEELIKDNKDTIKVFLYSDDESKVQRAVKYYGLDEKNALKQIKKNNKERQKHYKFYTNREWTNQNNYDLSINVDKYGVEKTADIICNFIK